MLTCAPRQSRFSWMPRARSASAARRGQSENQRALPGQSPARRIEGACEVDLRYEQDALAEMGGRDLVITRQQVSELEEM